MESQNPASESSISQMQPAPSQTSASLGWTRINFSQQTPLPGEVIILPFPMELTKGFCYGPTSEITPSSYSSLPLGSVNGSNNGPIRLRAKPHHVLILDVLQNKHNNMITIRFFPIFSYSKAKDVDGSHLDADKWMSEGASDAARLHHVPIPAKRGPEDWDPAPPPSILTTAFPILSFRDQEEEVWKNNCPSWLIMHKVRYRIPGHVQWFRPPNGPILLHRGDEAIRELYEYLEDLSNFIITAPRTEIQVHMAMVPEYHDVWADIYRNDGGNMSIEAEEYMIDIRPVMDKELMEATLGNDEFDPISLWHTPKPRGELQVWAPTKKMTPLDEKTSKWRSGSFAPKIDDVNHLPESSVESDTDSDSGESLLHYGEEEGEED